MIDAPDGDGDSAQAGQRLAANSEVHATAWEQTLDEMRTLEKDLQDDGWETLVTAAGHTAPLAPGHDADHWGLVHIVPDSDAAAIGEAVEAGQFPNYDVYRTDVDGRVFGVTVLLDPETSTAILVANQFQLREARDLIEHVHDVGHVDSVVRPLDGTAVAQVRHDRPEKFFPRYGEFGDE